MSNHVRGERLITTMAIPQETFMQPEKANSQDVLMPGILPMTWLGYAAEQSLPVADIVREADLVREQNEGFRSGVLLHKLDLLTQAVIRRSSDPAIGIEIGWHLPLTSFGDLGHAMLASATVGDAVLVCQRFWQLVGPDLILHFAFHDAQIVVSISTLSWVHGQFRRVTIDAAIVTVMRGIQALTPEGAAATEVWFDYPEPDYANNIRRKLSNVRFGMPIAQCRLPAEFLDHPLPLASFVGRMTAIQRLELQERNIGFQGRLSNRVQMRLGFEAEGYPTLKQTADALHMTERTLRRRLLDEGTSYSHLLDDARRRDAVRLLAQLDLDINDVAARLGYLNAANFSRAFRKWAGMAPSQFRSAQS